MRESFNKGITSVEDKLSDLEKTINKKLVTMEEIKNLQSQRTESL